MKKLMILSLSLILAFGLTACGGQKAEAPAAPSAPEAPVKAEPATPAEGSAPAAAKEDKPAEGSAPVNAPEVDTAVEEAIEEVVEEMEEEEAAEGGSNADKLMGTTWKFEDGTTFKFREEGKVNVSGGLASFVGEKGVDASFEYDEDAGTFVVSAMGHTSEGSWDGETLMVDGNAAVMQ